MAEAVGEEERVGAEANALLHIAFHQTEVLETAHHDFSGGEMHVAIGRAGLHLLDAFHIGFQHNLIDIFLFLSKFAAHRERTRHVGAVVHQSFHAGVHQQELALLQFHVVVGIVENFAVLGEDDGKRKSVAFTIGDAVGDTHQLVFGGAGLAVAHHGGVQLPCHVGSLLHLRNLAGFLDGAHGDDGLVQLDGGVVVDHVHALLQQVGEGDLKVVAVSFGEMDGARGVLAEVAFQLRHRHRLGDAHLRG